jgi:hypothetical protein
MNNIQIKGMLYKKACLSSSKIIAAKAENVKRGKGFVIISIQEAEERCVMKLNAR